MAEPGVTLVLTESAPAVVDLTAEQAAGLAALGGRLAGQASWWGLEPGSGGERRSVVRVRPAGGGRWEVRVSDAVGLLSVAGVQVAVHPKIPPGHLLPLLALGGAVPRAGAERVAFRPGTSLWEVLVGWYLDQVEALLRRDLVRDYHPVTAELALVRGRVDPRRTVQHALRGRALAHCEFDEFDPDSPLNRVLLAALRAVLAAPALPAPLGTRARRLALRFDEVGPLQPGDTASAGVDRRTWHYRDALPLARLLLRGTSASLSHGHQPAWAFLLRTPEPVEVGLRRLLEASLPPAGHQVTKRGLTLPSSTKTLNPDLVFDGGRAVGDVKYKLYGADWPNEDLYQVVAFAAGYRAARALVVSFSPDGRALAPLQVGDVAVGHVAWRADTSWSFAAAASAFTAAVHTWLSSTVRAAPVRR